MSVFSRVGRQNITQIFFVPLHIFVVGIPCTFCTLCVELVYFISLLSCFWILVFCAKWAQQQHLWGRWTHEGKRNRERERKRKLEMRKLARSYANLYDGLPFSVRFFSSVFLCVWMYVDVWAAIEVKHAAECNVSMLEWNIKGNCNDRTVIRYVRKWKRMRAFSANFAMPWMVRVWVCECAPKVVVMLHKSVTSQDTDLSTER